MSNATSVVDLPASPEQIRRAREIIERICGEYGVEGDIEVERYQDPELPEPPVALFTVTIRKPVTFETVWDLTAALPPALREQRLHTPDAPIMTYVSPEW